MKPSEFIKKHKINLNDKEVKLCKEALVIINKSIDINHNPTHIYRLLKQLDEFSQTKEYKKLRINLKILFLAILWHDVWKTKKDSEHIRNLIWHTFWEGIITSHVFSKEANKIGLDKKTTQAVKYAIRKHSLFQILPIKTNEAKILLDLDNLDTFNIERLRLIEHKYINLPIKNFTFKLAVFAVNTFAQSKAEKNFTTIWAKEKFLKEKELFLKRAWNGIQKYQTLLNVIKNKEEEKFQKYLKYLKEKYSPETRKIRNPF